ncbi:hypothetical protein J437_LFUL014985 [Ladona fulva]|uniref:Ig-like domain-containing protein n=1 Tax=Ladona fulva TaxID=123851 RepID=A0A8K0P7L3_LADFU|nr:hypothetical protein J437_LFUL014985 [Ladona fulva]
MDELSSNMNSDYPQGKPTLKVEKRRYGVGDTLRANCTAPASSPPANLTWLLNGRYFIVSADVNI